MVNDLNLFSTNEQLEEVATNEIKYLLLPGLLGYFVNKSSSESRFETVKKAQVYLIDFIRLCKLYGVTEVDLPKPYRSTEGDDKKAAQPKQSARPGPASIEEQTRKRQMKIERYKSQKELSRNLQELFDLVKKENVDDESKRNYYVTLLKKWINDALETCESIDEEIPLIEHMTKLKESKDQPSNEDKSKDKKKGVFRPFILTKDAMQKQVFGLGYPGVPTYTVDEFYQDRVEQGLFPPAGSTPKGKNSTTTDEEEKEAEKKEQLEDDDKSTRQAREWDDWKDDHRRGWGNAKNKG